MAGELILVMFFASLAAPFLPLLLIVPILLARRVLRRFRAPFPGWLAIAIVLTPIVASQWTTRSRFDAACREVGPPRIVRTATTDGVYLNSATAFFSIHSLLRSDGFAWVERVKGFGRKGLVRSSLDGAYPVRDEPISAVTARYEVEVTTKTVLGFGVQTIRIVDRVDGDEMARGSDVRFDGGPTLFVLGMWGTMARCPWDTNIQTSSILHNLARDTLRPTAR